jgi:hypothetical protein
MDHYDQEYHGNFVPYQPTQVESLEELQGEYYNEFEENFVLQDYYAAWAYNKEFNSARDYESLGELLAHTAVTYAKSASLFERVYIQQSLYRWSANLNGENFFMIDESPEFYQFIRGSEEDLGGFGADAVALPKDVLDQWAIHGRQQLLKGNYEMTTPELFYGEELGEQMSIHNVLAKRNYYRYKYSDYGTRNFVKIWMLVAATALFFKWIFVREREWSRQRVKFAYRLSDPGVKTENARMVDERHAEWLSTYFEEEEEDDEDEDEE